MVTPSAPQGIPTTAPFVRSSHQQADPVPSTPPPSTVIAEQLLSWMSTHLNDASFEYRLVFEGQIRKSIQDDVSKDLAALDKILKDPKNSQALANIERSDPILQACPPTPPDPAQGGSSIILLSAAQFSVTNNYTFGTKAVVRYGRRAGSVPSDEPQIKAVDAFAPAIRTGLPLPDLANLSFFDALKIGALVDVGNLVASFAIDLGLGAIPFVHFIRSTYKAVQSGVEGAKQYNAARKIRVVADAMAARGETVAGRTSNQGAGLLAETVASMLNNDAGRAMLTCASYALDMTVGAVDPTPATAVVLSSGRAAAKVLVLYYQWQMVLQANSFLAERGQIAETRIKQLLDNCPILACYALLMKTTGAQVRARRGGVSAGSGVFAAMQLVADTSTSTQDLASDNTARALRNAALARINSSPVKLVMRQTGHAEWFDACHFWDDQSPASGATQA